jgi:hypothetical protein
MVILEKFRKKFKFGLITMKKYSLQLFFIRMELGPTIISDSGLIPASTLLLFQNFTQIIRATYKS